MIAAKWFISWVMKELVLVVSEVPVKYSMQEVSYVPPVSSSDLKIS